MKYQILLEKGKIPTKCLNILQEKHRDRFSIPFKLLNLSPHSTAPPEHLLISSLLARCQESPLSLDNR